jgi:dUTP pyrophosphatase
MKIQFSLHHENAKTPTYANESDAAFDLYAAEFAVNFNSDLVEYETGVKIAIPDGYVGLIFPRSSISNKSLSLSNSVGVIDPGYSGTIKFKFRILKNTPGYQVGDRIGQMIIIPRPKIELEKIDDVGGDRGGFGSTGA